MTIYFTSDWHMYHKNIMIYEPTRPENWLDLIITDWMSRVQSTDTVIFGGDLAMGRSHERKEARQFLASLPGYKHWVLGNHDALDHIRHLSELDIVVHKSSYAPHPQILVGHYPLNCKDSRRKKEVEQLNKEYKKGNYTHYVHGHVHSKLPHKYIDDSGRKTINICIEVTDYKLVTLEDILAY